MQPPDRFAATPANQALLADLDILSAMLGQNLVGVYAAELASASTSSALQLLVVTTRDLRRDTKLGLVQALLRRSTTAAPLELLVVRQADLAAAHPALPVQLHFAEGTRPQFTADTQSLMWLSWPDGPSATIERGLVLAQLSSTPWVLLGPPFSSVTRFGTAARPVSRAQPPEQGPTLRQLALDAQSIPERESRE